MDEQPGQLPYTLRSTQKRQRSPSSSDPAEAAVDTLDRPSADVKRARKGSLSSSGPGTGHSAGLSSANASQRSHSASLASSRDADVVMADAPAPESFRRTLEQYERANDGTLTGRQMEEGFSTETEFRSRSNLTQHGYSTGYHESAITTDTYLFLKTAVRTTPGKVRLQARNLKSYFAGGSVDDVDVNESTVEVLKQVADGFRTDTARTIVSAPAGAFGGHPGSNMAEANSPAAHDLLRETVVDMLEDGDHPGMTPRAVAIAFGAITVTSMAPAELARDSLDTRPMKAGAPAKIAWEENRNEAKARVQAAYETLDTEEERNFVLLHATRFLARTQSLGLKVRTMGKAGMTPPRFTAPDPSRPHEVAGGAYDLSMTDNDPTQAPPDDPAEFGYYFTQPFRAPRQPTLRH